MSTPILLDCDPGHDDAIAILLALGSDEFELRGLTTVAGNQTLEKTTANAIRVLELAGRGEVPVAEGSPRPLVREPFVAAYVHGDTGLDGPDLPPPQAERAPQHAVDFLAERLEGTTLVATGPLTNVALLLARYPEATPERIVLVGGAIGEGNVPPAAEFNIWADPEAAARVFTSGLDVTMVGLDVTHQAPLTSAHPRAPRRGRGAGAGGGPRRQGRRGAARLLRRLPPQGLRLRRLADPRRRRRRPRDRSHAPRRTPPQRAQRLRVRALPRPHGRRHARAHRPRGDCERRGGDRLRALHRPVARASDPARLAP